MPEPHKAPTLATKAWLIGLVAWVITVCVLDIWALTHLDRAWSPAVSGSLAATLSPVPGNRVRIQAIEAESPLAAAGAKVGDVLLPDHLGDLSRQIGTDEVLGFTLLSSGERRHIDIRPVASGSVPFEDRATMVMTLAGTSLMLFVGALVGWRRAESVVMRCFSASLLSQTLLFAIPLLPGGLVQSFVAVYLNQVAFAVAYVCFVYFVLAYTGAPLLKRRWGRFTYWVYVGLFAAHGLGLWVTKNTGTAMPWPSRPVGSVLALFSAVLSLSVLFWGWRKASGITRQRLAWLSFCMGWIYAVYFGGNVFILMAGAAAFPGAFNIVSGVVICAANCGLGYALLRHRVLDFGFAVNRALVYGTTSLVLAGAFILAAQLINRTIHFSAREHSQIIDIALGLGLALAARQVVRWVDPRVQRIFFRGWHASAAKLERFRGDAMHGEAPAVIESQFVEAVKEFSNAQCALYRLHDDRRFGRAAGSVEGAPELLDEADPLVQRMRATRLPLDLARSPAGFDASLALPMVTHGRVTGLVVIGPKRDDEHFRKDEIRNLALAAERVGRELELARLGRLEAALVGASAAQ